MLKRDSQRENAELVILSLLEGDGPLYGYAISKEVAARSDQQIRMTPGVLYPLLRELETDGLISGSVEEVRSDRNEASADAEGRKRKWYKLTAKGRKRLAARVEAHRTWRKVIDLFIANAPRTGGEGESKETGR
jgi:PadR family transcriptional regulator PadR